MSIMGMKVSDILSQKISDIQGRLPVKMNGTGIPVDNFSSVLSQSISAVENNAPVIDPSLVDAVPNSGSASKTAYPLVSGSYESNYTRLTQAEITDLMPRIDAAIDTYSKLYNVDPKLIRALMKQESAFQPFALSTSGAMGLMQLMPGTADGLGVSDPYNIEENIRGGTQYLSQQIGTFNNDLELALAAYNAGPNAVKEYGGIPPYEQTQNYVKMVMQYYDMYKALG